MMVYLQKHNFHGWFQHIYSSIVQVNITITKETRKMFAITDDLLDVNLLNTFFVSTSTFDENL